VGTPLESGEIRRSVLRVARVVSRGRLAERIASATRPNPPKNQPQPSRPAPDGPARQPPAQAPAPGARRPDLIPRTSRRTRPRTGSPAPDPPASIPPAGCLLQRPCPNGPTAWSAATDAGQPPPSSSPPQDPSLAGPLPTEPWPLPDSPPSPAANPDLRSAPGAAGRWPHPAPPGAPPSRSPAMCWFPR
jgi:hypothetical protein